MCPAAIFHYFPAHFSLFPMGHFIAISYLLCCDISLFPSPFFIVSLGTFHCYFISILLPFFIVSLGTFLPGTFHLIGLWAKALLGSQEMIGGNMASTSG